MAGKTELGKARKPKTPRKTSKAGSKKRAAKSASETASRMYAVASGRASAKGAGRTLSDQDVANLTKRKSGRMLSDQDVSNIASAVSRIMAAQSGRTSYKYIGEEAKRRAGRTVSDQDKVFGRGVGFKKGGSAKKRAKGGRAKK